MNHNHCFFVSFLENQKARNCLGRVEGQGDGDGDKEATRIRLKVS